jgi:hypothetical protein
MTPKLNYYRLALWLALAVALTELVLVLYIASYNTADAKTAAVRILGPLAILLGLWLQSNTVRFLGVLWLIVASTSAVWPLFSSERLIWFVGLWALVLTALSLELSGILLFSKQFAAEFSRQREAQPKYKKVLFRLIVLVLLVLALIATWNDIHTLFSAK